MKTWNDLTFKQQTAVVSEAFNTLRENLLKGLMVSDRFMGIDEMRDLALSICQNGQYDDAGKPHVQEEKVPSYYFGGCI